MTVPYNKRYNALRRGDELDARPAPSGELKPLEGGFSARMARLQRRAKSARKAAGRVRKSRKMAGV